MSAGKSEAIATGGNGEPPEPETPNVPFLLDFYPLEDPKFTRLSPFYEALKAGRLQTTQCPSGCVHWPPRVACPNCHSEELHWIDLPMTGTIYAFSAVLAGAPLGMEGETPFVVGLVDLDGVDLRIFGRIHGSPWTACRIGQPVAVETYTLPDGRAFYRFRTTGG